VTAVGVVFGVLEAAKRSVESVVETEKYGVIIVHAASLLVVHVPGPVSLFITINSKLIGKLIPEPFF
jgi:hypothetical protein